MLIIDHLLQTPLHARSATDQRAGLPEPRPAAQPAAPTTAHLALVPDHNRANRLPSMHTALWYCEALHRALIKHATAVHPYGHAPACLTGRDQDGPMHGHRHASLLPMDLDRDGCLDHVAVHAPMGLDAYAIAALQRTRRTFGSDLPSVPIRLLCLGDAASLSERIAPMRRSRVWVSHTPFVPSRHLKSSGPSSLAAQVRAELVSRGMPLPERIAVETETGYVHADSFWSLWRSRRRASTWMRPEAVMAGADTPPTLAHRWSRFHRCRRKDNLPPPVSVALGLRLIFAEPVLGPLSLGYASHFGLGLFIPESARPLAMPFRERRTR